MKNITSSGNAAFKAWKKLLHSARTRRREGRLLVEGPHLLEAWQRRFGEPVCLIASESGAKRPEIAHWLSVFPKTAQARLSDALFAELADAETPQGLIAEVALPVPAAPPSCNAASLLLDGVQDPGNLGALLRTAAAAGIGQILLSADCADAYSPRALRAGQGAQAQLSIHAQADLPAFLAAFSGTSLAASPDAPESLFEADWQRPAAWAFGAEGQGVSPAVLAAVDKQVAIPMPGGTESLNVAAAAAICLFEGVRRSLH
jgi:TrmH family RNA methyltransferase